jgi:hypothetical protein
MPNFTPDYLSDSSKKWSLNRGISDKSHAAKRPKKQTVRDILAFSKALEVHRSTKRPVELILN